MSDTQYIQNPVHPACLLDEEIVILNTSSGDYFNLQDVARDIWEKLVTPTSFDELVSQLLAEYPVSPSICKQETKQFLNELHEGGFVIEAT